MQAGFLIQFGMWILALAASIGQKKKKIKRIIYNIVIQKQNHAREACGCLCQRAGLNT